MITNFALSLSSDGIELLHRVPRGWRRVGRVDIASETLDDDLKALRQKALTVEPDGLRTKLIIPLDQIKYIAIDGTLTTDADIHAALEGETPYALDELIIDSEKFGGRTHIAAVARETLQEAEAFAAGHGFQPVSFVAVPEPFTFQKEVFFGPTDMARSIVGPDALIARDDLPVMVVGTRLKSRLLVFDLPKEAQQEIYKDDLAALLASENVPIEKAPEQVPAPATIAAQAPAPRQAIWIDHIPAQYHVPAAKTVIPTTPVFSTSALLDPVVAEYHNIQVKTGKAPLVAVLSEETMTVARLGAAEPAAHRTRAPKPNQRRMQPALIAAAIAAAVLILGGVIWTQQDISEVAAIAASAPMEPAVAIADTPATVANDQITAPATADGPSIPRFQMAELDAPRIGALDVPTLRDATKTDRMTLPDTLAVTVADAPIPPVQSPPAPPPEDTAQARANAPVLRGQVLSPAEANRIYQATGVWQRAPRLIDIPSGTLPFDFRAPAINMPPDRIAQPDVPSLVRLDTDLSFIAPADPPAQDVVFPRDENGFILATPEGTVTPEGALVISGLPDIAIALRPELSQSDLDRMALLAPAPDGVVVIAGRPDIVAPLRPADAELPESAETEESVSAAIAESVTEDTPPTLGSVGIAGLELQNSGNVTLDPEVVEANAVVDLRPRLRPQGLSDGVDPGTPDITDILASIETDDATLRFDNSTSLAVVLSVRPDVRPANFGNVVVSARAQQQTQPVAAAAPPPPVTAAAPVQPQNLEPVPGGVARAATQEDAIRLRDINLIGVYGRANARRALVRLSNGRYIRVEVGSALDGGQVTAIGEKALNYVKRGRTYAIELPSG